MKIYTLRRLTLPLGLLTVGALASSLQAANYGSLRGSNHSSAPSQAAPRQQAPAQASRPAEARPAQPEVRPQAQPAQRDVRPEERPAQPRPQDHFQPAPQPVERARVEQADARRLDIAPERQQAYFWSGYHKDMRVDRLPDGYRRIGVGGHFFYYFSGVFYDDGPSGYVVVAPPLNAEIPDLPPGAETVVVGDTVYYYVAGAFYLQQPDGGYAVVPAPLNAVVSLLPPDASEVDVNGTAYYAADGVYYQPVMQNGVTAYLTVPQP